MVVYNYSGKEVNAKIVYYGPALSGKTTNLEWIYSKIPVEYSGKMVSLRTQADRTIFFDFLPLDLGMVDGFRTRFMLYTVPGQVHYNATRKMVLKGVDGLVFVADSEPGRMQDNIESLQNLRDNLVELGLDPEALPIVLQWNKRDLPNCMTLSELETELNGQGTPSFEACALTGEGVYETLHKVCRMIYTRLTGIDAAQLEAADHAPLFGASIAQCLQDVDIPQPEPERVAIGAAGDSGPRRSTGDALGAILGSPPRASSDADSPSSPRSLDPGAASAGPPPAPTPTPAPAPKITPRSDDDSGQLGGLVDEVLDALDHVDDLHSVDKTASRPVVQSRPAKPLEDGFEDLIFGEPTPTAPAPSNGGGEARPEPPEGFAVEHDESVFDHLNSVDEEKRSGLVSAVREAVQPDAPADEIVDLDTVLGEDQGESLDLITDPLRLPVEHGSTPSPADPSGSFSGPISNARVMEVPLTVDASELEQGKSLRIVLNLQIRS